MEVLVLLFFKSILHTLNSLVDNHSAQQALVITYLINSLEHYIPLLSPMHRLTSTVLKVLVGIWCAHNQDKESAEESKPQKGKASAPSDHSSNIRGCTFVRIRQIALLLPGTATEDCFRTIYLAYTRHNKSYNEQTSS